MKMWHVVFAAIVIGICDFCGCRLKRLARRVHIL
jgi:hypothetical protein